MKYLLDSNIIIRLAMASGESLRARAAECDDGDMVTSAIALAEVAYGSAQGKPPALDHLHVLLEEVPVLDFDLKAALAQLPQPQTIDWFFQELDRRIANPPAEDTLLRLAREHGIDITPAPAVCRH